MDVGYVDMKVVPPLMEELAALVRVVESVTQQRACIFLVEGVPVVEQAVQVVPLVKAVQDPLCEALVLLC